MNVDQMITTVINQMCPGMFHSRYSTDLSDFSTVEKFIVTEQRRGRKSKMLEVHVSSDPRLLEIMHCSNYIYFGDREWNVVDEVCAELNKQLAIYKMVMI